LHPVELSLYPISVDTWFFNVLEGASRDQPNRWLPVIII